MYIINGKKYYNVDEVAKLGNVSVRTLRRWLSANRLSDFLFPFRSGPNEMLYRLEAPEPGEPKNEKGEYVVSTARAVKGGMPNEGSSS